jgi:hypothetical protein
LYRPHPHRDFQRFLWVNIELPTIIDVSLILLALAACSSATFQASSTLPRNKAMCAPRGLVEVARTASIAGVELAQHNDKDGLWCPGQTQALRSGQMHGEGSDVLGPKIEERKEVEISVHDAAEAGKAFIQGSRARHQTPLAT